MRKQAMCSWFSSMARWSSVWRHPPGPADQTSTSQPWRTYQQWLSQLFTSVSKLEGCKFNSALTDRHCIHQAAAIFLTEDWKLWSFLATSDLIIDNNQLSINEPKTQPLAQNGQELQIKQIKTAGTGRTPSQQTGSLGAMLITPPVGFGPKPQFQMHWWCDKSPKMNIMAANVVSLR